LRARNILKDFFRDLAVNLVAARTARCNFPVQEVMQTAIGIAVKNLEFVVAVFRKPFDFLALDCQSALVLVHTVAVEHAHFHDRAGNTWRQAQ
jgi:hypothetical protein